MSGFRHRLRRALKRHGVIGLLALGMERIASLVIRLQPSVRAQIRERAQREIAFDQQFNVDTAGCINQVELNINNPNQLHAVAYGGSDPKFFKEAIGSLSIDYRQFVLIDFGSGKGRVILMAMEYPFKRIIGVEFSEELHRIAQDNIRRFHSDTSKCTDVETICMDVVDYTLPNDCLICYFCNPFDAMLMGQMLARIQISLLRNPREIFIVYYNPKEAHVIDHTDCFRRVGMIGPICIWKTMVELQELRRVNP